MYSRQGSECVPIEYVRCRSMAFGDGYIITKDSCCPKDQARPPSGARSDSTLDEGAEGSDRGLKKGES